MNTHASISSVGGSQQQRLYRIARRDGATMATACVASGLSAGEARLLENDDLRNPPPPEAFELLGQKQDTSMTENVSADQLRQFIERAERLIEERKGIGEDLKDVFAEAKSMGFDVTTMKWAIRERAKERHIRDEQRALQETYQLALAF